MALVYLATSPSGKHYVGVTSRSLERRRAQHEKAVLGVSTGCRALSAALLKYRKEGFVWRVLVSGLEMNVALSLEQGFIRALGTLAPGGYNLTTGGEAFRHSKESVELSASKRRGQKRTAKSRRLMSTAQLGKRLSKATKDKISAAMRGRPRPRKLSVA